MMTHKKRLLKSFVTLVGGVAFAQLVVILLSPVLTRLYTPESFGLLATYMSIIGILSVVGSYRYELAIPSTQITSHTINLFTLNGILIFFNFILLLIIIYFLGDTILTSSGLQSLIPYKWLIPIGFLLSSLYKTSTFLTIKEKKYKAVAQTKIVQSLSMVSIQVAFFKLGAISLLFGHIVGQSLGIRKLLHNSKYFINYRNMVDKKRIYALAHKYQNFPKYSLWSAIMNTTSQQLPTILLTSLFGPIAAGFYALGQKVIFLPVTLITGSIVSIIFGEGVTFKKNNTLKEKIWYLHKILTQLSLPLTLSISLILIELFSYIFGAEWRTAGEYAVILMPWFYLVFTLIPVFDTFETYYNQKITVFFQTSLIIGRTFSIYYGYTQSSVYIALLCFTLVSVFIFLGFFGIILNNLKIKILDIFKFYRNLLGMVLIICMPLTLFIIIPEINSLLVRSLTLIPATIITVFNARKILLNFNK